MPIHIRLKTLIKGFYVYLTKPTSTSRKKAGQWCMLDMIPLSSPLLPYLLL